jgi:hypothetical protein
MPAGNELLLKEMGERGLWFHARKCRPIWVRRIDKKQTVVTLEGTEEVSPGDYLCRGEAGDIWPQSSENLMEKYTLTDESDAEGWLKCVPRPDARGVMAAKVPHPFQVRSAWGLLSGKAGDFVVKDFRDKDVAVPEDLWIVDSDLFEATYAKVAP